MNVTKVEAITKTKFRVEVEEEFAFVLYKGELKRYGVIEGEEISKETYDTIRKDVILKRAKLRAMHLLTDMPRTEKGLREKLKQNQYPEDLIDQAMDYVSSFGYLNDLRYAENYIDLHKKQKSKKELRGALLQKGVPSEQIDFAFESFYDGEEELEAIQTLIRKKRVDVLHATDEQLQKLYGYLGRKGFRYEQIRKAVEALDNSEKGY